MTPLIDRLRELANGATCGPWHIGHVSEMGAPCERAEIDNIDGCLVAEVEWRQDQTFICSVSPEVILKLCDAIEVMREGLKRSCYCDEPAYRFIEPCLACEALAKAEEILK